MPAPMKASSREKILFHKEGKRKCTLTFVLFFTAQPPPPPPRQSRFGRGRPFPIGGGPGPVVPQGLGPAEGPFPLGGGPGPALPPAEVPLGGGQGPFPLGGGPGPVVPQGLGPVEGSFPLGGLGPAVSPEFPLGGGMGPAERPFPLGGGLGPALLPPRQQSIWNLLLGDTPSTPFYSPSTYNPGDCDCYANQDTCPYGLVYGGECNTGDGILCCESY